MNEAKPVPTYIGAFLKGGCVSGAVFFAFMSLIRFLLLRRGEDAHAPAMVAGMICMFSTGGCAGLFLRLDYRKYFATGIKQIPTKIGAFLKGGCVSFSVFLAYIGLAWLWVGNYAWDLSPIIICVFAMGGFAGLFLRWDYRNHFTAVHTPTTDAHA